MNSDFLEHSHRTHQDSNVAKLSKHANYRTILWEQGIATVVLESDRAGKSLKTSKMRSQEKLD